MVLENYFKGLEVETVDRAGVIVGLDDTGLVEVESPNLGVAFFNFKDVAIRDTPNNRALFERFVKIEGTDDVFGLPVIFSLKPTSAGFRLTLKGPVALDVNFKYSDIVKLKSFLTDLI